MMRGFSRARKEHGMAPLFSPGTQTQNDTALLLDEVDMEAVEVAVRLVVSVPRCADGGSSARSAVEAAIRKALGLGVSSIGFSVATITSPKDSVKVTNRAIERAASNVDKRWLAIVDARMLKFAVLRMLFTSDDVWKDVDEYVSANPDCCNPPADKQAAGKIFKKYAHLGLILDTGTWRRSDRPEAHRKKLTVWQGNAPTTAQITTLGLQN